MTPEMKPLLLLSLASTCLAGDFINLDFNSPDLSHAVYDPLRELTAAPVEEALRGWSVSYSGLISVTGGAPPFGLDPSLSESQLAQFGPYRVVLNSFADIPPFGGTPTPRPLTTLSQRGTVPVDASSLDFFATSLTFPADPASNVEVGVFINGVQQSVFGSPLVNKQVDVWAFAGQEVLLEFSVPGNWATILDVRGFTPVPEPQTWALLSVGLAALGWHAWRQQ
jgi:hypothetical protein